MYTQRERERERETLYRCQFLSTTCFIRTDTALKPGPCPLTPRKPRDFQSREGWLGTKADLEVLGKKKIFCAEIRTLDFPARALVSITPTHNDSTSKTQFSVVFFSPSSRDAHICCTVEPSIYLIQSNPFITTSVYAGINCRI